MRRARRPSIPQRRRVFLGCEGESERSYGVLLAQLLESQRRDIHLDVVLLRPGGGDPLSLVERAVRRIQEGERKRAAAYSLRAMLIDFDKIGESPQRDARIGPIAERERIRIIWQRPCHEALLLRHIDGCHTSKPPTPHYAIAELRKRWPEYERGMPAAWLGEKIEHTDLRRALGTELELRHFLLEIGYRI